ncbi:MAG: OmpA family protein [Pseudomonadota bacterium]
MIRLASLFLCGWATTTNALELSLPGATEVSRQEAPAASVRLPRAAWQPDVEPEEVTGAIRRRVLQVPNPSLTTLQLVTPLMSALLDSGYTESFSCADRACGGFDFRFKLDLLPAPDMFVDLGNYRYVLMENPGAPTRLVALVASSSADFGHIHITEVSEQVADLKPADLPAETVPSGVAPELIVGLLETGHAVLSDLEFATGSAELGLGPFPSLSLLADWLRDTPSARIVLVGHTDAVGSLDANLALSRRRALSVRDRLVASLGTDPRQVSSDGAGALSPIASNLAAEGRATNRRVEVVLLAVE